MKNIILITSLVLLVSWIKVDITNEVNGRKFGQSYETQEEADAYLARNATVFGEQERWVHEDEANIERCVKEEGECITRVVVDHEAYEQCIAYATPTPSPTLPPEPTATPAPTNTPTPVPTIEPTSTPTPEPTATPECRIWAEDIIGGECLEFVFNSFINMIIGSALAQDEAPPCIEYETVPAVTHVEYRIKSDYVVTTENIDVIVSDIVNLRQKEFAIKAGQSVIAYISHLNEKRQLTSEQIVAMMQSYQVPMSLLQVGALRTAYGAMNAIAPDGTIVTDEFKAAILLKLASLISDMDNITYDK